MNHYLIPDIKMVFLITIVFLISCKKQNNDAAPVKGAATSKWIDNFTRVQWGTMPVVISVPHGGMVAPDSLPNRSCPNITTALDSYTIEMANAIDSVAGADYGWRPFLVVTHLKRTKLDQNRNLPEATCSNPAMYRYWYNFHNSIDTCIQKVLARYPQCLYIDLHAHGHSLQRLELGYLITKTELQNINSVAPSGTSLKQLFASNANLNLSAALTGPNSFGTLMQNEGYPSVPSAAYPAPATADPYFDGGYNTARYSVLPKTFGWQIESNYTGVRENKTQRALFAKAFLKTVITFCEANTQLRSLQFGY